MSSSECKIPSHLNGALRRWSAEDLAREFSGGVTTIRRAELREHETSITAANDLSFRRAFEKASNSSTRTAADLASVSANLSGKNNPNNKQSLEIALEREEISFIAELEGRIGGAAGEEAAARLVLIL
jgi:hypothetical protein